MGENPEDTVKRTSCLDFFYAELGGYRKIFFFNLLLIEA